MSPPLRAATRNGHSSASTPKEGVAGKSTSYSAKDKVIGPTRRSRGRPRKNVSTVTATAIPEKRTGSSRTTASPKPGGAKGSATSAKKARYGVPSSGTPKQKAAAKGTLVAKDFPGHGLFIGEVIKVNARAKAAGGTSWKVLYEDQDMEDLDQQEVQKCAKAYDVLQDRFAAAQKKRVTSKDLAQAGLDVGNGDEQPNSLVGVRVRKLFPLYDEEFDGTVSKHFPPQEDDNYGNLWLIKYDDGDAEHMNSEELDKAKVLYKKHYGLVKKRVKFCAGPGGKGSNAGATITLYGEQIPGSRVFATIAGYRNYKKASTAQAFCRRWLVG